MSPITAWDATARRQRNRRARPQWRTPATMNAATVALVVAAGWVLLTLPTGFGWAAWPVGIGASAAGVWVNKPRFNPRYLLARHRAKRANGHRVARRPARQTGPAHCSDRNCPYRNPDPQRPCRCSCGGTQCGVWLR